MLILGGRKYGLFLNNKPQDIVARVWLAAGKQIKNLMFPKEKLGLRALPHPFNFKKQKMEDLDQSSRKMRMFKNTGKAYLQVRYVSNLISKFITLLWRFP